MNGHTRVASAQPSACLNCAAPLSADYCARCGQKASTQRFTLPHLLHDIPHAVFHVSRGIVPTVRGLLRQPGRTINAYLDGQRTRHFNPLTLLALAAAAYALLYSVPFFWSAAASLARPESRELVVRAMLLATRWYSLSLVVLVPLMALGNWMFLRSEGRNLAEHVVIVTFINAGVTLLMIFPLYPLIMLAHWAGAPVAVSALWLLGVIVTMGYQVHALAAVFSQPGRYLSALMRASLATTVVVLALLAIGMGAGAAVWRALD
jgi:Protein of unknown function (DUF3667)